jgi:uncharacterized protein (TIGR03118 family)
MSRLSRSRTIPALAAGLIAVASPAAAAGAPTGPARPASGHGNEFRQVNLISDLGNQGAQIVDPNLVNPWGLAFGPATPLWVADNNAGVATVYRINVGGTMVAKAPLTVMLPGGRASTMDGPSPTGEVFNPTGGFVVTSKAGKGPALFIFSAEAGQISAWSPKADPIMAGMSTAQVEFSSKTAVYKGLAIASTDDGTFVYASNFHDGTVDVFNSRFHKVRLEGGFRDRRIPKGFAPFGIQAIRGFIYVTYAKQNPARHDDLSGPGRGFIDIYTREGFLVKRLVSRGALNSPWGLALAPGGFGPFSHKLVVGNFGDGLIHAYDPFSGKPLGALLDEHGMPIQIDDLWALKFGTDTTGGEHTLLFSAGIMDEMHGLVGSINHVR